MLKFDPTQINTVIVRLKTVTTSLGGSISIVDESRSTADKEVLTRIAVPLSVVRSFIMKTKRTRYLKPVYTALVKYGDHVVAMERHPLAGLADQFEVEGLNGNQPWKPTCSMNMDNVLNAVNFDPSNWYFDGRYVYAMQCNDQAAALHGSQFLTADGMFRKVVVRSYDLQSLPVTAKCALESRTCVGIVTSKGDYAISPPIWKDVSSIGASAIKRTDEDDDEDDANVEAAGSSEESFSFDSVNGTRSVNLNFVLKAAREVGATFGYEHVEPLQLSRLMIELRTVNLPNVPKDVKSTYDTGLKFSHVVAWLLGISRKADTLETYLTMRSLLKYVTKRGIFRKDTFSSDSIFKEGKGITDVEPKPLGELLDVPQESTLASIVKQIENAAPVKLKFI